MKKFSALSETYGPRATSTRQGPPGQAGTLPDGVTRFAPGCRRILQRVEVYRRGVPAFCRDASERGRLGPLDAPMSLTSGLERLAGDAGLHRGLGHRPRHRLHHAAVEHRGRDVLL